MTKARDLADLGNKTSLDEINDAYDAGAFSNRNLIINGGFNVWQRGTSFSNFNHAYSTDRWTLSAASSATVNKTSDTIYGNVCQITLGSTDTNFLQLVENLDGFMANKDMTLSFWVKSSTITSSHCVAYNGSGFTHDVAYNVSGSWTKVVLNFNTGSTYTAGTSFRLYLLRSSNTTGVIEFAQVQLEVGDTATPFEHRSYAEELTRCERYYERLSETNTTETLIGLGVMWGNNRCLINLKFNTEKRANPTVSFSSSTSNHVEILNNSGWRGGTSLTGIAHQKGARIDMQGISGATGDQTSGIAAEARLNPAIVNPYIEFDAEL